MIARMMFVRAVVGTAIAWMLLAEVCGCRAPLASERTEALSATEPQEQAKDGDATAQYNLGICYYNGDGVAVDKAEAVKWLRKAAEKGHPESQTMLGMCYLNGEGVAADKTEAVKWLWKAAEQGYLLAQEELEKISGTVPAEQFTPQSRISDPRRERGGSCFGLGSRGLGPTCSHPA